MYSYGNNKGIYKNKGHARLFISNNNIYNFNKYSKKMTVYSVIKLYN